MKFYIIFMIAVFTVMLKSPLYASLEISVATDKQVYQLGETVEVYVSVYNPTAEDITLNMATPPMRYLMDETYFWQQNMTSVDWTSPLDTVLIQSTQTLTWQLDHDETENAEYTLGVGIHTVRGYVYSTDTIGQYSELVEFQVVPEPATLCLFALGAVLLKKKR